MKPYTYNAEVLSVYDGDSLTLLVDLGFGMESKRKVRLLGINAPELRSRKKGKAKQIEKQAAIEARDFLRSLLPTGTKVILWSVKMDVYGRSLGCVYLDGMSVSNDMLNNTQAIRYDGIGKATWEPPTNPKD